MINRMGLSVLVLVFGSLAATSANASPSETLLTGIVSSSAKQVVSAPRASRWQIQIQWLAEEGSIVEKGDLVAVFDGATELERLEQNKEQLERLSLEYTKLELEQDQLVVQAQGQLTLAEMRTHKAKIEASVPVSQVSQYEKGQFDLALQQAMLSEVKARESANKAIKERQTNLQKKNIDILKVKEEITYLQDLLTRMNVTAMHSGPVTHAMHPWYGDKLSAGNNVQASWKILDVQASTSFEIQTWVHEIDAINLDTQSQWDMVIDAYPSKTFKGIVKKRSTQSEKKPQWSKSAYFPIIIGFEQQPDVILRPGMSVRIHAKTNPSKQG